MIITHLGGGLGNQMFQYALGRKMSLKNKDIFKLDISAYDVKNPRQYELGHFNIIENIATPEEIRKIKLPYGFFSRLIRSFKARVLRVFNVEFKPHILEKKGNMYLDGFWQTEKYFTDIRENLLKDFSLKNGLKESAAFVAKKIESTTNPVSLHVRRGDYAQDAYTNAYWGTCDPSYYTRTLAFLKNKIGNFTLFIFSDDIDWVKENMTFDMPTVFVSNQTIADYEEIILMSKCSHHIIANSSFSWWGAWLGQNPQKIVLAPKRWQIKSPHRVKDIVPNSWIKI